MKRAMGVLQDYSATKAFWPVGLSAAIVLVALCLIVPLIPPGHLATSTVVHIAVMNVAAPTLAMIIASIGLSIIPRQLLWPAAGAQLAVLVSWHLPAAHSAAGGLPMFHAAHISILLAVATAFWLTLLSCRGGDRWRAIFALLITGKVACLIGALLIFAPRAVYTHHGVAGELTDQQLAGLLMIAACPLSYVVAGVVFAAQWLAGLEAETGPAIARRTA